MGRLLRPPRRADEAPSRPLRRPPDAGADLAERFTLSWLLFVSTNTNKHGLWNTVGLNHPLSARRDRETPRSPTFHSTFHLVLLLSLLSRGRNSKVRPQNEQFLFCRQGGGAAGRGGAAYPAGGRALCRKSGVQAQSSLAVAAAAGTGSPMPHQHGLSPEEKSRRANVCLFFVWTGLNIAFIWIHRSCCVIPARPPTRRGDLTHMRRLGFTLRFSSELRLYVRLTQTGGWKQPRFELFSANPLAGFLKRCSSGRI